VCIDLALVTFARVAARGVVCGQRTKVDRTPSDADNFRTLPEIEMTHDEFDSLVFRLEQVARSQPGGYRFRVLLLALLGNAYISAIILLLVSLLLALAASVLVLKALAVKFILIIGVFLWVVLKALWVKVPPPDGTEISERDAPQLFAMIDDLEQQLDAPPFHKVLITDDFNAGVVQAPRLGVFGWYQNYLLIGLPLMKSLTEEQFKAVLAHEFGHLAKGHGRMSNWIYRLRLRWSRLMSVLEQSESKGSFLFRPFLNWYAPYFNAYSFPLARANEYEADATSVRLTSPAAAAQALTGVDVIGSYLYERYWPQIHRQADELPQPRFAPYSGMAKGVASELDPKATYKWLQRALQESTTSDDTHPALTERLKAIGQSPHLAPPQPGQAADRLLGMALERITETFDQQWQQSIQPRWEERYQEVQEGRQSLAQLEAKLESDTELTLQEAFDRACLTESYGAGPEKALVQFRELHQRKPDDPVLCYHLGMRMLNNDEDGAVALVERAMDIDEAYVVHGAEALRDYYWRHGSEEQAHVWYQRWVERTNIEAEEERERNEVRLEDKFERHGLSDETLAELRGQLKLVPGLRKAWLVRKRVKHFPERPMYLLGYAASRSFISWSNKQRIAEVLEQIKDNVTFPGETLILSVEGGNYRFGRKFRWVRRSRII
jgi:Zn-dependent protease with chaperone function